MIATQAASKYVQPCWLTMRQANELSGHVRKAEESAIIVFWKVEDRRGQAQDESDAESDGLLAPILWRLIGSLSWVIPIVATIPVPIV